MNKHEFLSECGSRYIDVNIALENNDLRDALLDRDDDKVIEILDNEF